MSNKTKRFILPEEEIPHYWYNIQADMVNKPMPPLNPATKQPLKAEDLYPVFAEELCRQELNQTDAWIEIPEQVREMYKYYRSTQPATVGIDLHAKTAIRICSGDAQQWRNQPKREWDKYTFGCYGCWVMDDDGNLDYVSEEDYTEELWNEQKKSGERNRATALHK